MEAMSQEVYPFAAQLSAALEGAVYPLTPRELVCVARENEAAKLIVTLLAALRPGAYRSLDEVTDRAEPFSAGL
jgi:hypothetical protein